MKRLGITQRVEVVAGRNERRDCLDQRWWPLALELGYLPIPLPNLPGHGALELIESLKLQAVIFSGGNSLAHLDKNATDAAPERDAFEAQLFDAAVAHQLPILGVCRGMQFINHHLGGKVSPVTGHVGQKHPLQVEKEFKALMASEVNSFHNFGIAAGDLAESLQSFATDESGHVEGFWDPKRRVAGIMWHPEREQPYNKHDIALLRRFLS